MPKFATKPVDADADLDPDDIEEADAEEERVRLARANARRQARELGIDGRVALRALAADVPLERLQGVELYRGNPVFTTPPAKDDPLRRLIDLKTFSADQLLEWMKRQARSAIVIPRDANDDRLDPTGEQDFWQHYQFNGIIWPVKRGEAALVPWPIAEDWTDNHPLRVRFEQFRDRPAAGHPTAI